MLRNLSGSWQWEGSLSNRSKTSRPSWCNSGWMMLRIPPTRIKVSRDFSSQSRTSDFLNSDETRSRSFFPCMLSQQAGQCPRNSKPPTSCPCSNHAGEILMAPGLSPPATGVKNMGPDLQFPALACCTLRTFSRSFKSSNIVA